MSSIQVALNEEVNSGATFMKALEPGTVEHYRLTVVLVRLLMQGLLNALYNAIWPQDI